MRSLTPLVPSANAIPLCVTFDFQSLEDHMVTVRERDSMSQERVKIDELNSYIHNFLAKNRVR